MRKPGAWKGKGWIADDFNETRKRSSTSSTKVRLSRLLVDTNIIVWWPLGTPKLSAGLSALSTSEARLAVYGIDLLVA